MRNKIVALLLLLLPCQKAVAQSTGDIVITEFMANPAAVADAMGEWLEIQNVSQNVIDLEGWHLRDSGTDDIVLPPWQLQPGTILLLCNNPDGLTNGGLPAGLAYSGYTLANSSDEIILTDSTGLVIDSVLYTNTFSGKSWELDPGHLNTVDNDDFSNWCLAVSPYGLGDFGTPASANNFCSLGIGDASGENEMFIYTEKENLFVHSTLKQDSPWEISGINGSLVLKGVSPSTETFSISIESLTPGVYLFRMRNGKAVRFVVPE